MAPPGRLISLSQYRLQARRSSALGQEPRAFGEAVSKDRRFPEIRASSSIATSTPRHRAETGMTGHIFQGELRLGDILQKPRARQAGPDARPQSLLSGSSTHRAADHGAKGDRGDGVLRTADGETPYNARRGAAPPRRAPRRDGTGRRRWRTRLVARRTRPGSLGTRSPSGATAWRCGSRRRCGFRVPRWPTPSPMRARSSATSISEQCLFLRRTYALRPGGKRRAITPGGVDERDGLREWWARLLRATRHSTGSSLDRVHREIAEPAEDLESPASAMRSQDRRGGLRGSASR